MRRPVIVAIEGIDGAGKNTLTTALVAALRAAGRRVSRLGFPRYAVAPLGPAVRAMLTGDEALAPVAASARASALLFALDRANALPELAAAAHGDDVVLVDRYVASNAAYGAARLPEVDREAFRDWVAAVEFDDLALPRPDLQVLLRVPVEVAWAQARSRAGTDADRAVDRYETDGALQNRVAGEYERLARLSWGGPWLVVDRADDGAHDYASSVNAAVEKVLGGLL